MKLRTVWPNGDEVIFLFTRQSPKLIPKPFEACTR